MEFTSGRCDHCDTCKFNSPAIVIICYLLCTSYLIAGLHLLLSRHFLVASWSPDLILLLFLPPHHLLHASCVVLIAAIDMLLVAHRILWIFREFAAHRVICQKGFYAI